MDYNTSFSQIKIKYKSGERFKGGEDDKDYTAAFKHTTDKKKAYSVYHKEHPLYLTGTDVTKDLVVNQNKKIGDYIIQIVWMEDKIPVFCALSETQNLEDIDLKMIKCSKDVGMGDTSYWNKINLTTYDKENNKIWSQIIPS